MYFLYRFVCFINSLSQIGKVCLFYDIGRPAIYTTNIFRIKVSLNVDNTFVYFLFSSDRFQKKIQTIAKPAVNQASFTKADLITIDIPFPQLPEQQKIAQVLSLADQEIEQLNKQLKALKEQKRGLMQQLLTGKIRVKVTEVVQN